MPQDSMRITTSQLRIAAIALTARIEIVSDLAVRFDEQQDVTGIVGCILAITELLSEKEDLTANIAQDPEDPHSQEEWEDALVQAQEMMDRENHRTDDVRYRGDAPNSPEVYEGEVAAAGLAASVISVMGYITAAERLGRIMADQGEEDGARWAAFGVAHGMTHSIPSWEIIDNTMETPAWTSAPGVRDEIRKLMCEPSDHPQSPTGPLRTRARVLCREYGIEHPSEEALDRPGVISDLVISRDPGRRYQLSLEMGAPNDSHVDIVMFRYRDETHVKTIGEPFPRGFPGPTALEIAREFLRMCGEPERRPEDADWRGHREAGTQRRPGRTGRTPRPRPLGRGGPHRQPGGDLPAQKRHAHARDEDHHRPGPGVHDLILPLGLATQTMTARNDTTRLVREARKAGLRKTEMWELARFLGIEPGNYGIIRPEMGPETAERVGQAMLTAGIPESAMTSVLEELAGDELTGTNWPGTNWPGTNWPGTR